MTVTASPPPCTVTKAYTRERGGTVSGMNDIRPKGIFETEECGTLMMITPPEGRKIPEYVETAKPGKKYLFHVANSSLKRNEILIQPALKKSRNNISKRRITYRFIQPHNLYPSPNIPKESFQHVYHRLHKRFYKRIPRGVLR